MNVSTSSPVPVDRTCPHCGSIHDTTCPRISAIEYHANGTVKRIEFHGPHPVALGEWRPSWTVGKEHW